MHTIRTQRKVKGGSLLNKDTILKGIMPFFFDRECSSGTQREVSIKWFSRMCFQLQCAVVVHFVSSCVRCWFIILYAWHDRSLHIQKYYAIDIQLSISNNSLPHFCILKQKLYFFIVLQDNVTYFSDYNYQRLKRVRDIEIMSYLKTITE